MPKNAPARRAREAARRSDEFAGDAAGCRRWPAWAVVGLALTLALGHAAAGELEPSAPPAPSMKTLPEIEPRIALEVAYPPIRITESGSYYLTGDVDCAVSRSDCIVIDADDVALDLMGFVVLGGESDLIDAASQTNISIRNGTLRGGFGVCVNAGGSVNVRIEKLSVYECGSTGIATGHRALVADCVVSECGWSGIHTSDHAVVRNTVATDNAGGGIRLGNFSRVSESVAAENDGPGIMVHEAATGASIVNCTARNNGDSGIIVQGRSFVANNTLYGNSPGSRTGAGIEVNGTDNRIEANNLIGNDVGVQVIGTGNVIIRNSASGNGTNYDIAAGNDVGPIGSAGTATSPWANISF